MNSNYNVTYDFKGCENKSKEEIKEIINSKLLKVICILEKTKHSYFNKAESDV